MPRHGSLRLWEPPEEPDPSHVLTWRQTLVLRAIKTSVAERGYSPSLREIGKAARLSSTSSVWFQITTLQRKGYLYPDESQVPPDLRVFDGGRAGAPSRPGEVVKQHACPECGARKGKLCVSGSGKATRDLHMARWREDDRARRSAEAPETAEPPGPLINRAT